MPKYNYDRFIRQVKEAYVICEGCGNEEKWESQDPPCSEGCLQDPKKALRDTLKEDGWAVRKGKLYCPECKKEARCGPMPNQLGGLMELRYPMKPSELWPDSLQELDEEGESYAEQKLDGFRTFVVRDVNRTCVGPTIKDRGDGLHFMSRRGRDKGGPTNFDVCEPIVEEVGKLDLPDLTMLDGEWLSRRTKEDGIGECLYLFDVLWLEDQWQGDRQCWDRRQMVAGMTAGKLNEFLRVPECAERGFVKFFERQKEISYTEGVVIKEKDSTIPVHLDECHKTGLWQKIKWRSGHDGREVVA